MEGTITHSTTTFKRIVALYHEQRRFAENRAALASLWPKERTRAGD
jgi:hypothetical protein